MRRYFLVKILVDSVFLLSSKAALLCRIPKAKMLSSLLHFLRIHPIPMSLENSFLHQISYTPSFPEFPLMSPFLLFVIFPIILDFIVPSPVLFFLFFSTKLLLNQRPYPRSGLLSSAIRPIGINTSKRPRWLYKRVPHCSFSSLVSHQLKEGCSPLTYWMLLKVGADHVRELVLLIKRIEIDHVYNSD